MAEPIRIRAFSGMNRRLNPRILGPQQDGPTAATEIRNLAPSRLPSLFPRRVKRFIHEDLNPSLVWPLQT